MRLQLFTACEKVLLNETRLPSLIVLLQELQAHVVPMQDLPKDAVVPKEWALIGMWLPTPDDVGKEFVQRFDITWPDGSHFMDYRLPFKVNNTSPATNYVNIVGIPIGQVGAVTLRSWVELQGTAVTEVVSVPLLVKHVAPPQRKGSLA